MYVAKSLKANNYFDCSVHFLWDLQVDIMLDRHKLAENLVFSLVCFGGRIIPYTSPHFWTSVAIIKVKLLAHNSTKS